MLADAGAEIVVADMEDPDSLDRAFAGAYAVYSVQNFMTSGLDGEVRQGRNVGDAAHRAGVRHLVQGSAGTGERGTGVGSFESKLDIEEHLAELGLPVTVLAPDGVHGTHDGPGVLPARVWHVWPKLADWSFRVPWLSCHDLGRVAEHVFAQPERFIGRQLCLAADVRSLEECRQIYTRVLGRAPRRLPMPVRLFERFAPDTAALWRWANTADLDVDPAVTRSILVDALTVETWLRQTVTTHGWQRA